jgi:hypothetical protein
LAVLITQNLSKDIRALGRWLAEIELKEGDIVHEEFVSVGFGDNRELAGGNEDRVLGLQCR